MHWVERGVTPEQSEKKIRVSSSYDADLFEKLDRLACAIGVSPTTLQTQFIKMCLDSEDMITEIQERYKRKSRFRIIPSRANGELKFIFAEKARTERKRR